jgi:hypothetical protein
VDPVEVVVMVEVAVAQGHQVRQVEAQADLVPAVAVVQARVDPVAQEDLV